MRTNLPQTNMASENNTELEKATPKVETIPESTLKHYQHIDSMDKPTEYKVGHIVEQVHDGGQIQSDVAVVQPAESETATEATLSRSESDSDEIEFEEVPYIKPLEDPLEKANKYLSKHDIFGLLQSITAGIAYHRPGEPLEFMIGQIEQLQEEDRRRKGVITHGGPPV